MKKNDSLFWGGGGGGEGGNSGLGVETLPKPKKYFLFGGDAPIK